MNPIYRFNVCTKQTNLFSIYSADNMIGYAINPTNGVPYERVYHDFNCSGFLRITQGGGVLVSDMWEMAFYDAQKNFLQGVSVSSKSGTTQYVVAPEFAAYVRVSFELSEWNTSAYVYDLPPVKPTYKDDLAKDWELESNQRFYRAKLSGKINFVRNDYDYFSGQPFDTEFILIMSKSDDGGVNWFTDFVSKFMKTDCTWNADDKKMSVQPNPLDEYNDVLAGLEKEYNLIELAPQIRPVELMKRPLIQIYIPGDSVVSCFLGGMYWEQDAEAISDRNALVNTYYFALCNLLKEVNVTGSTNPNVNALYSGRMSIGANNTFTGNLYPNVTTGYYIRASQVYQPPFWGVIIYEFVRSSDSMVVYRYTYVSPGNRPEDNLDFDAPAVSGSGATGSAHCEMATYSIYARYLCDVEKIGSLNTYNIPSEDIVENNRNYRRVIGYAIDVAFISNNSTTTPTQWGIRDDGTYFQPPYSIYGQVYYPIARSTWRYASIWFGFYLFDYLLEMQARKSYRLRDAYPLYSCISVLLKQFAPGITHEPTTEYSQFLYADYNPVSGVRNTVILLTQKSNILHGDYDRPAQKAPTTLQQLTNMLRDCFRAYWYIEDGKFKVEHIRWFRNGGSYNSQIVSYELTKAINLRNGKNWAFNTAAWDFDKVDMVERYQFAWMDDVTKGFEGEPIQVISKYVTAGKIEDVNISNFTSDVDYMMLNPGAISEDGFALLGALQGNALPVPDYGGNTSSGTNGWATPDIPITGFKGEAGKLYMTVYGTTDGSFSVSFRDINGDMIELINSGNFTAGQSANFIFDCVIPSNAYYVRAYVNGTATFYWNQLLVTNGLQLPFLERTVNGVDYYLQNGYLSFVYLQPTFYVWDLPASRVQINGSETYAMGVERKKKQTVNYPNIDDPNPIQLIKTSIGTGQVEKISINLSSRMNKLTIKHDTE